MKTSYKILLLTTMPALAFACSSKSVGTGGSGGASDATTTHAVSGTGTTGVGPTTGATMAGPTTGSSSSGPITCTTSYSNIPKGECDILQQDCTNGNTCVPFQGAGGNSSVANCQTTAPGLKAVGSTCTMDSECAKGLFCFDVCTPPCCPDNMEPCAGGECNLQINIQNSTDFYFVCSFSQQCTLFSASPTNCPANQDCHPESGISECVAPSGANKMDGDPCTFINDCANMQACVSPAAMMPAVCRFVCTPGSNAAAGLGGCPANETCQPTDTFMIDNIGLCSP